ncbi:MAG: DUF72 domain-containing protein [Woeseiaceae bacterium]|nr:DUF72 domain-containing protein [Woeseiaceae bacterium]
MFGDRYFLGLPAWAFPGWKDRYFTDAPSRLASYAQVFNTVEGNTTFYRVPDEKTALRWRKAVAGTRFRFCFKLPRTVTHERNPDLEELQRFLSVIDILKDALGPLLVQFPATVGPEDLKHYEAVFDTISKEHRFVIEVRHPVLFEVPSLLEPLLERFAAGRVVLDSRPLYQGDRSHPEVLEALHEKPDLPVLPTVYNGICFIRLILHPDIESNRRFIDEWASRVAAFLADGIETYMMVHCPNNLHCPPLALNFHDALTRAEGMEHLTDLAPWPLPTQLPLV